MKNDFLHEFGQAAKAGSKTYFAPLVGAIKAVKRELTQDSSRIEVKKPAPARPATKTGR